MEKNKAKKSNKVNMVEFCRDLNTFLELKLTLNNKIIKLELIDVHGR